MEARDNDNNIAISDSTLHIIMPPPTEEDVFTVQGNAWL